MKTLACLLLCGTLALPATAQKVWRCGADGRIFSDRPCADGRAWEVDARVTAEAATEARQVSERERASLQRLAGQRLSREAEGRQRGAAGFRPAPAEPHEPVRKPRRAERRPDARE
jgi:hypothetical protein